MSGPKVVRVVTREELVAAGQALLARLDAAVAQWQIDCGNDVSLDEVKSTTDRREGLAKMLAADKFAEVSQAAAKEIDFLESDAVQRRQRRAQAKAMERMRAASGQELARTLLRQANGLDTPARQQLEDAASGRLSVAQMDAVLSRAAQALAIDGGPSVSPEHKELAARLGAGDQISSFEEWKAYAAKPDVRLQAAFTFLAELTDLGFKAEASELEQQLAYVQAMADEGTRDMRLDTLVLATRKARDSAAAKSKMLRDITLLVAQLRLSQSAATAVLTKLEAAGRQDSIEQLQALSVEGRAELDRAQAGQAAAARREAVLKGLQTLGYEVQEGLSTLTPESGKLVVRSPGQSAYGVEVVTGAGQKLQVRSVAFEAGREASQDVAEERRWCTDFSKLQADLKAKGCDVVIEKALGVGTAPLKLIELEDRRRLGQATHRPNSGRVAR